MSEPTPEQLEDFEERAAIREYLGNMSREEAERLAAIVDHEKRGPRKSYETAWMRNPLAAAAVVALAGAETDRSAVLKAVSHYDYSRMHMAEFFFGEVAYYALPELK